jgi:hypothetical protein
MAIIFVCALCGDRCMSTWSDEEAAEEYRNAFGCEPTPDEARSVCDECYQQLMAMQDTQNAN